MGRKAKYTKEQKVQACKDYLRGKKSAKQIAFKLNPTVKSLDTHVFNWVKKYKLYGPSAFDEKERNSNYSKSFKETVVKEYLLGKGSFKELANQYNIPSSTTLRNWVMKYNKGKEIKDYYPEREIYFMKSRKVTCEEKKEIIDYVLANDNNYKEAAVKYNVPYHQVYNWVKKYKELGEISFQDKRGRPSSKSIKELTETERLQSELEKQKRINERLKLANEILKKTYKSRKSFKEILESKKRIRIPYY